MKDNDISNHPLLANHAWDKQVGQLHSQIFLQKIETLLFLCRIQRIQRRSAIEEEAIDLSVFCFALSLCDSVKDVKDFIEPTPSPKNSH